MIDLIPVIFILDLVVGDPEFIPHPIRIIGSVISLFDNLMNKEEDSPLKLRMKGVLLALFTLLFTGGVVASLLFIGYRVGNIVGMAIFVYLGYTTLATRDLLDKAILIYRELKRGELEKARYRLSMVVGRDTKNLNEEEITRATIESVSESINDGIIAPLFYLLIGGPLLAMLYKSINTLDSMVGYRNERYLQFGWFSAKLDDIANFIPARICGVIIPVASLFIGKNAFASIKVLLRDGQKHPSPNSGISEAAVAGALGIRVGGSSTYQGKLVEKEWMGDNRRKIEKKHIIEAILIALSSSIILLIIGVAIIWLV